MLGRGRKLLSCRPHFTSKASGASQHFRVGWCVEAHDGAASKCVAFREKDRDFVRVLLTESLIKPWKLVLRIRQLPGDKTLRHRLVQWVGADCGRNGRGVKTRGSSLSWSC
jgi:hypothetical protein